MFLNQHLTHIETFEEHSQKKLMPSISDFINGGAGTEWGVRNNRHAFFEYQIIPYVLNEVNQIDLSQNILGIDSNLPIIIGPCAFHKLVHPQGELETAIAAEKSRVIMALSTMSSYTIEEVAVISSGEKWFQLYVHKNNHINEKLIRRAEQAGYKAIIVSVDVPVMGKRLRDIKNKFCLPDNIDAANFRELGISKLSTHINGSHIKNHTDEQFSSNITWETIDWIRAITDLPIILKGILNPENAEEALKHSISGIIVSNHGGRQLDSAIASIDALSEIKKIVYNKITLFLDGGIRSGEDVFKALALGATAVLIARPVLWSLAIGGEEALITCLNILKEELELTMRLTGCSSLKVIRDRGSKLVEKKFSR